MIRVWNFFGRAEREFGEKGRTPSNFALYIKPFVLLNIPISSGRPLNGLSLRTKLEEDAVYTKLMK